MNHDQDATIVGLISAFVWTNIPPELFTTVEKLFYGAGVAFIAGFSYKAGGWIWEAMKDRIRAKMRGSN